MGLESITAHSFSAAVAVASCICQAKKRRPIHQRQREMCKAGPFVAALEYATGVLHERMSLPGRRCMVFSIFFLRGFRQQIALAIRGPAVSVCCVRCRAFINPLANVHVASKDCLSVFSTGVILVALDNVFSQAQGPALLSRRRSGWMGQLQSFHAVLDQYG